ncbi:MAG TPA: hypothetical protein VIL32_18125 [Steroidobacteraceae bacterium]
MNESTEHSTRNALAAYAEALRDVRPSAQLDERIEAAIREASTKRVSRWRRRGTMVGFSIAASVAAFAMGLMLLTRSGPGVQTADTAEPTEADLAELLLPESDPFAVISPAPYSLWPNEAEVFRVRASLGALGAALESEEAERERQFWVDVRIANDGSMRIVRIVPADEIEWAFE